MKLFKSRRKKRQDQYQEYVNYQENNEEEVASNLFESEVEDTIDSESSDSFEGYEQEDRREAYWEEDHYGTAYLQQESHVDEIDDSILADPASIEQEASEQAPQRRAKYSAKIDHFLNNGIIIVGALLVMVLLIAFLA
ncbi:hypothetical protein HZY91_02020 [Facklamia sp. DSM 111018]|uniref:Uncharacterized protein n=1 Tax=Facklamia lactis TaxID=2749967 RepID=A0ABS0LQM3_9LACT|nr:hypothetical protein [Facklamia lactis]MBG9979654.1 hypothetical protein [Facklamia lactis]MBG9985666.1 hypothetical protein [Facklamia lactis]